MNDKNHRSELSSKRAKIEITNSRTVLGTGTLGMCNSNNRYVGADRNNNFVPAGTSPGATPGFSHLIPG